MAATAATRIFVKEKAKQYLDMWYIGKTVGALDDIAERATEEVLKTMRMMGDKQIIHNINHTDALTDALERMAKEECYTKALDVSRPAKREYVDVKKSKTSQAKANAIVKELMYVNPYEVMRYNSTDGLHCVTSTRGFSNYALIKFDGRVIRNADHLMRLIKKYEWVSEKKEE